MVRHEWARFRRSAGFTQESIAEELGVSRYYVINLEKGLYERPPGLILSRLAGLYKQPSEELLMAYRKYVSAKREEFKENYPSFRDFFGYGSYAGTKQPLVLYRESNDLSRSGLCKGLCLHPKTVEDYEKNRQRGIPEQLIAACSEIFWDYVPLENAVTEWRVKGYADRKGA